MSEYPPDYPAIHIGQEYQQAHNQLIADTLFRKLDLLREEVKHLRCEIAEVKTLVKGNRGLHGEDLSRFRPPNVD